MAAPGNVHVGILVAVQSRVGLCMEELVRFGFWGPGRGAVWRCLPWSSREQHSPGEVCVVSSCPVFSHLLEQIRQECVRWSCHLLVQGEEQGVPLGRQGSCCEKGLRGVPILYQPCSWPGLPVGHRLHRRAAVASDLQRCPRPWDTAGLQVVHPETQQGASYLESFLFVCCFIKGLFVYGLSVITELVNPSLASTEIP